jgi:hypothetical protein
VADKNRPARLGDLELAEQAGGTSFKHALIPLPVATYRGGVDENGQPLAFIPGVPTRDLTQTEWDALPDELRQMCLTTKLYDVAGQAPAEG